MVDDLEPERQYQFWVTAVTNAGEGMRSDIVVQTPSKRGKNNRYNEVNCIYIYILLFKFNYITKNLFKLKLCIMKTEIHF